MPDDQQQDMQRSGGGSTPKPDPTVLTTEAVNSLENRVRRELGQVRELIETRVQASSDTCNSDTKALKDVTLEKFKSIGTELDLIERQRVELKKDTKDAVDAALAAAKEAVTEQTAASDKSIEKSETAAIKSIEQLGDRFDSDMAGIRREVSDVKERQTTTEGQRSGAREVHTEAQGWQQVLVPAVVSFLIAALVIAAGLAVG